MYDASFLFVVNVGIQPHVTIYHFDFPQALQDEYNGLISHKFMYLSLPPNPEPYCNHVYKELKGYLLHLHFVPLCRSDFTAYADACFKNFGNRVKYWSTVNEPNIETVGGYDEGILPPQRCSSPFGFPCNGGNSTTEPYIAAHHLLLAHASAVSLYREKYQV